MSLPRVEENDTTSLYAGEPEPLSSRLDETGSETNATETSVSEGFQNPQSHERSEGVCNMNSSDDTQPQTQAPTRARPRDSSSVRVIERVRSGTVSADDLAPLPKLMFPASWDADSAPTKEYDVLASKIAASPRDASGFWKSLFPRIYYDPVSNQPVIQADRQATDQPQSYRQAMPRTSPLTAVVKAIGVASCESYSQNRSASPTSRGSNDALAELSIKELLREFNLAESVARDFQSDESYDPKSSLRAQAFPVKGHVTPCDEIVKQEQPCAEGAIDCNCGSEQKQMSPQDPASSTVSTLPGLPDLNPVCALPKDSDLNHSSTRIGRLVTPATARLHRPLSRLGSSRASSKLGSTLPSHVHLISFVRAGFDLPTMRAEQTQILEARLTALSRSLKVGAAAQSIISAASSMMPFDPCAYPGMNLNPNPSPRPLPSSYLESVLPNLDTGAIPTKALQIALGEAVFRGEISHVRAILRQAFLQGMRRNFSASEAYESASSNIVGEIEGDVFAGRSFVVELVSSATFCQLPAVLLAVARDDVQMLRVLNDACGGNSNALEPEVLGFVRGLAWPLSIAHPAAANYIPILGSLIPFEILYDLVDADSHVYLVHWAQLLGAANCFAVLTSSSHSEAPTEKTAWTMASVSLASVQRSQSDSCSRIPDMSFELSMLHELVPTSSPDSTTTRGLTIPIFFPSGVSTLHRYVAEVARVLQRVNDSDQAGSTRRDIIMSVAKRLDDLFTLVESENASEARAALMLLTNPASGVGVRVSDICLSSKQYSLLILIAYCAISAWKFQSPAEQDVMDSKNQDEGVLPLPKLVRLCLIWAVEHLVRWCPQHSSFRTKDLGDLVWLLVQALPEPWMSDHRLVAKSLAQFLNHLYNDVDRFVREHGAAPHENKQLLPTQLAASVAYSLGSIFSEVVALLGLNTNQGRGQGLDALSNLLHPSLRLHVQTSSHGKLATPRTEGSPILNPSLLSGADYKHIPDLASVALLRSLVEQTCTHLAPDAELTDGMQSSNASSASVGMRGAKGDSSDDAGEAILTGEGGGSSLSGEDQFLLIPTPSSSSEALPRPPSSLHTQSGSILDQWEAFVANSSWKQSNLQLHSIIRFRDLHQFIADYALSRLQPTSAAHNVNASRPKPLDPETVQALNLLATFEANSHIVLSRFRFGKHRELRLATLRPPAHPAGYITQIFPTDAAEYQDNIELSEALRLPSVQKGSKFAQDRRPRGVREAVNGEGLSLASIGIQDGELWSYYELLRRRDMKNSGLLQETSQDSALSSNQATDSQSESKALKFWKPPRMFQLKPNTNKRDLTYIPFDETTGREWTPPKAFVVRRGTYRPNPKPVERPPPLPKSSPTTVQVHQYVYNPTIPRKPKEREPMPKRQVGHDSTGSYWTPQSRQTSAIKITHKAARSEEESKAAKKQHAEVSDVEYVGTRLCRLHDEIPCVSSALPCVYLEDFVRPDFVMVSLVRI